jgi:hypothetical protein
VSGSYQTLYGGIRQANRSELPDTQLWQSKENFSPTPLGIYTDLHYNITIAESPSFKVLICLNNYPNMRFIVKKNLLAFTFSLLTFAAVSPATAATFSEQPGNNEQITEAQNLGSITGDNTITGSLTATPLDIDLFAFSLQAGSTLTASVDDFTFDTQLFLFNSGGFGLTGNDNTDFTFLNPSFSFTVNTAGVYYLGITGNNYDPIDAAGNFIFSDDATGNFSVTSAASLAGWTKRDPSAFDPVSGNYTINISTPVPEPSAFFGMFAWAACMAQIARKRKTIA